MKYVVIFYQRIDREKQIVAIEGPIDHPDDAVRLVNIEDHHPNCYRMITPLNEPKL